MWLKYSLLVIFVFFNVFSSIKGNITTASCYSCKETQPICQDPVNLIDLPSYRCADLLYVTPRSQFDGEQLAPSFSDEVTLIYQENLATRTIISENVTYECVKIGVKNNFNGSTGIFRSCLPRYRNENTCELLQQEVSDNYTMTSCLRCEGDNCNSSSSLEMSLFIGSISLILTIAFFK